MYLNSRFKTFFLLAFVAFCSACAGTPPMSATAYANDKLRDTERDLIFATEFPVASKAEALLRADTARKAGNLDKALFFYVKALQFDPQDADLLTAIGLLHQYLGNSELAVRAYTLALRAKPNFAQVLEARGLILLAHDENQRAFADLTRAIELSPDAWRAHNGLGLLANRNKDHDLAISNYDRALAVNPNSGAILNNRGYSKLLASHYEGAEDDLRRAAQALGHRQAWVNLGTLLAWQGHYKLAVDAYEKVLPEPEAFNNVAEASINNGDYEMAAALLEQAIRRSPIYFPAAEKNLAQLRLKSSSRL